MWHRFAPNPLELAEDGNPPRWKTYFAWFMVVWAALISQLFLILQLEQLYQTRSTEGISLIAFILMELGNLAWLVYGMWALSPANMPIVVSSGVSFLLGIIMIIGIIIYS